MCLQSIKKNAAAIINVIPPNITFLHPNLSNKIPAIKRTHKAAKVKIDVINPAYVSNPVKFLAKIVRTDNTILEQRHIAKRIITDNRYFFVQSFSFTTIFLLV